MAAVSTNIEFIESNAWECPICKDTMTNPVKLNNVSAHTFCKQCIKTWLEYDETNPLTGEKVKGNITLIPNDEIKQEKNISLMDGLNGWEDLPAVLIAELAGFLCHDIKDLHKISVICTNWRISFKYQMNNNEDLYYNKLLSTAIFEIYLDNDRYCNWIDTKCRQRFSEYKEIQLFYCQYCDNIEKAYFAIFTDESDKDYPSKSFLWKSIAQYFTDNLTPFLSESVRVNKGICIPTYQQFKKDKYLKQIVFILQCLVENECIILCGYLLNILLKSCKFYQWSKKASLYLKDCVIVCFGLRKYRNNDMCNNIIALCNKLSDH